MAATSPTAPATWTAKAVPLNAIERELDRLWQRPSAAEVAEGVPAVARAHVLNFVTYAKGVAMAAQVAEIVEHLATRHPSRTIIVVAEEGHDSPGLEAVVSAHAQPVDGGSRQILYEQVRITARGDVTEGLPSIIVPLLLPDLPTYLWWPGDPPVGHAFWRQMVEACDRLIVNSGDFTDPIATAAQFADFYRNARRFHSFGDLSWTRLDQWRELIAQFFDSPVYQPFLEGIQEVHIEYSDARTDGQPNPSRALLLAGWLATRLGWESSACQVLRGGLRFHMVGWPSGRALSLGIEPRPAGSFGPATVLAVRITAAHDGQMASFIIEREAGTSVANARAEVDGTLGSARTVSMVRHQLSVLLAKELEYSGNDPAYEAALVVTATMAVQARKAGTG